MCLYGHSHSIAKGEFIFLIESFIQFWPNLLRFQFEKFALEDYFVGPLNGGFFGALGLPLNDEERIAARTDLVPKDMRSLGIL